MSLDQKIQIWAMAGTWLSGSGTIAAVITALYLAERVQTVRLKLHVGLMEVIIGDGSPFQKNVGINVTNLGDRPVTINTVGGLLAKGKSEGMPFSRCTVLISAQNSNRACPRQKRQLLGVF